MSFSLRAKLTTISLHFFPFNFMLLLTDHLSIVLRSDCRTETSFFFMDSDIVTSSTYFQWSVLEDASSRSLIIIIDKMGPNLVP